MKKALMVAAVIILLLMAVQGLLLWKGYQQQHQATGSEANLPTVPSYEIMYQEEQTTAGSTASYVTVNTADPSQKQVEQVCQDIQDDSYAYQQVMFYKDEHSGEQGWCFIMNDQGGLALAMWEAPPTLHDELDKAFNHNNGIYADTLL